VLFQPLDNLAEEIPRLSGLIHEIWNFDIFWPEILTRPWTSWSFNSKLLHARSQVPLGAVLIMGFKFVLFIFFGCPLIEFQ
jgi:hypothetical protein